MPLIRVVGFPGYGHMIIVAARSFRDDAERILHCQHMIARDLAQAAGAAKVPTFDDDGTTLGEQNWLTDFSGPPPLERTTALIFVDGLFAHDRRDAQVLGRLKTNLEQALNEHLPKGYTSMAIISAPPLA